MIEKPIRNFPTQRPLTEAVERMIDNTNRGWGVDSETIIFERLPDGRIRPHLHPKLVKKFGL